MVLTNHELKKFYDKRRDAIFINDDLEINCIKTEKKVIVHGNVLVQGDIAVLDDFEVHGNLETHGGIEVGNNMVVFGHIKSKEILIVKRNLHIYESVITNGHLQVNGNVKILKNLFVEKDFWCGMSHFIKGSIKIKNVILNQKFPFLRIGNIGSRNSYTIFYFPADRSAEIFVTCGCFSGTLTEFEIRVKESHEDGLYRRQYLKTIEYVKNMRG